MAINQIDKFLYTLDEKHIKTRSFQDRDSWKLALEKAQGDLGNGIAGKGLMSSNIQLKIIGKDDIQHSNSISSNKYDIHLGTHNQTQTKQITSLNSSYTHREQASYLFTLTNKNSTTELLAPLITNSLTNIYSQKKMESIHQGSSQFLQNMMHHKNQGDIDPFNQNVHVSKSDEGLSLALRIDNRKISTGYKILYNLRRQLVNLGFTIHSIKMNGQST